MRTLKQSINFLSKDDIWQSEENISANVFHYLNINKYNANMDGYLVLHSNV